MNEIVVMTDFSSTEGSTVHLRQAVELLTGRTPAVVDARHFYDDAPVAAQLHGTTLTLQAPGTGRDLRPSVIVIYEIPPADRCRFTRFQALLGRSTTVSFGDQRSWRSATDKHEMVGKFTEAAIPQMDSVLLDNPGHTGAMDAFRRLGGDVWARPAVGFGGRDVFHLTSPQHLAAATRHFSSIGGRWLLTQDARNIDAQGRRHQYRVVVLGERILRVCEHVQHNPDAPCNEAQGAVSTVLPVDALPRHLLDLAVKATRALGLPFGGVDLAAENGGVVFEVNVHPVLDVPHGYHTVTVPFVHAHLNRHPHYPTVGTGSLTTGNEEV